MAKTNTTERKETALSKVYELLDEARAALACRRDQYVMECRNLSRHLASSADRMLEDNGRSPDNPSDFLMRAARVAHLASTLREAQVTVEHLTLLWINVLKVTTGVKAERIVAPADPDIK